MAAPGSPAPVDPAAVAFRAIRSGNVYEECVERVLSAVKLGLVLPGDRLPAERDLAVRLGVSRVTLRDALRSLTETGWVEVRRGRHGGTFVRDRPPTARTVRPGAPLTPESLEDTLALRRVLELGAVELAATTRTKAEADRVLTAALADCTAAGPRRYRTADSRLHLAISERTGSASLAAAVADIRMKVSALLDAIPLLAPNIVHSNRQHEEIVGTVLQGDPGAARAAMEEHLSGTSALLRGFLS